ncbi:MAG TPA: HTTM domain-containing protein, partial [Kofleriaceae bacterium]|nr:HTTM domain-containing protein [Kofleriaceae bacterium]
MSRRRRRGTRAGQGPAAPATGPGPDTGSSTGSTPATELGSSGARKSTLPPGRLGRVRAWFDRWVGRWVRAWIELWDRREPPTIQALVRILVAIVLLSDLLQARSYGLVEAIWGPPPDGLAWGSQGPGAAAAARWFGASIDTAWLLWWTAALSAICMIAGFATRLSVLVLALSWAQLGYFAPDSDRGIDFMLRAVLLVLVFSHCHACWSVDAWLRRRIGRPFPAQVPAWPRYLLFAQVCWIYFSAGHNKSDKAWGPIDNFTALANILTDPHFARFDPAWVDPFFPMLQLSALATMVFELSAPLMILFTYWYATRERPGRLRRISNLLRLRWLWIITGVGFHIGIALMMRLGIFPWGMMALYPVL